MNPTIEPVVTETEQVLSTIAEKDVQDPCLIPLRREIKNFLSNKTEENRDKAISEANKCDDKDLKERALWGLYALEYNVLRDI